MKVTALQPVNKTKWKVELDGQFAFVLYKGELSRFGIKEGTALSDETYTQIQKEIVLKRAKLKAMHLLTDMARTESGLREKLRQGMYTEEIVEQAVAYVKSFGYLDDYKYAEQFIDSRKVSKSEREIRMILRNKGISPEIIDQAFDNSRTENGEQAAIRTLIRKKHINLYTATEQELHKLYNYLARKGFRYEDVRQVIQNYDENA